jgi:hypothetical protein
MDPSSVPDSFIVTVANEQWDFEADLEIPAFVSFAEFKDKLLEILKIIDGDKFRNWRDYCLRYKNHTLAGGDTLARVGAFDGSRLVAAKM